MLTDQIVWNMSTSLSFHHKCSDSNATLYYIAPDITFKVLWNPVLDHQLHNIVTTRAANGPWVHWFYPTFWPTKSAVPEGFVLESTHRLWTLMFNCFFHLQIIFRCGSNPWSEKFNSAKAHLYCPTSLSTNVHSSWTSRNISV